MSPIPDLEALSKLCEAATPGPWERRSDYGDPARCFVASVCGLAIGGQEPENHAPGSDADLIVACRTEMPALIAHARELREGLRELIERLDFVAEDEAFKSVWLINQIHAGPYQGPTYVGALEKARALVGEPHE